MIRSDILAENLHKNHSLISLCEGETSFLPNGQITFLVPTLLRGNVYGSPLPRGSKGTSAKKSTRDNLLGFMHHPRLSHCNSHQFAFIYSAHPVLHPSGRAFARSKCSCTL